MEYDFYPFTYPHEKWVYKNRCVIKVERKLPPGLPPDVASAMRKLMSESHLNGYVTLPKSKVPKDWWGNTDAPGLNRLAIHGNITYCEIEDVPHQERYFEEYKEALDKHYKRWENKIGKGGLDQANLYMKEKIAIKKAYIDKLSQTEVGYVVFGFDCNHHGDAQNPAVHDVNHVMMLTEQMENQLLLFADRYQEYIDAENTPATTEIVQTTIIREIRRQAELKTQMGLGGMLDILMGKTPIDDLPE